MRLICFLITFFHYLSHYIFLKHIHYLHMLMLIMHLHRLLLMHLHRILIILLLLVLALYLLIDPNDRLPPSYLSEYHCALLPFSSFSPSYFPSEQKHLIHFLLFYLMIIFPLISKLSFWLILLKPNPKPLNKQWHLRSEESL